MEGSSLGGGGSPAHVLQGNLGVEQTDQGEGQRRLGDAYYSPRRRTISGVPASSNEVSRRRLSKLALREASSAVGELSVLQGQSYSPPSRACALDARLAHFSPQSLPTD